MGVAEKRLSAPLNVDVLRVNGKHSVDYGVPGNGELRRDSITVRYRPRTTSESSHKGSRRGSVLRPLYRDDIFLQGSLHRIPQYTSQGSKLDYTLSVSRLPTHEDVEDEVDGGCKLCPEAVRRTLATMLDFSLLLSPTFLLFCAAGAVTMLGIFVPFMYLAERAMMNDIDRTTAVWIVSSIGITNTLGRIVCGALTSLPGVNSILINNLALTMGGIATMCSGYSYSLQFQFAYATIFGLSLAAFASLRSIMIVDLFGLEKLTNAFGLLLLFQGVAAVIGAPVAGSFMDLTGSYDASFYLSGFLILLSGVMCYPLSWLKNWEMSRNQEKPPKIV